MHINTDKAFPAGLRVKHKEKGKFGTVQAEFEGRASDYDPWEVPVQWDGDLHVSGVTFEYLINA